MRLEKIDHMRSIDAAYQRNPQIRSFDKLKRTHTVGKLCMNNPVEPRTDEWSCCPESHLPSKASRCASMYDDVALPVKSSKGSPKMAAYVAQGFARTCQQSRHARRGCDVTGSLKNELPASGDRVSN